MFECKTILLVEDDPAIQQTIAMALELEGYEVQTASNGEEGLELLSRIDNPCLILLDLMMPVMNGWEFAMALKQDQKLAQIPISIMTAFSDRIGELKDRPLLKKPVPLDELTRMVKTYCGGEPYP